MTTNIELTKAGAPRPADSSPLYNEWVANNPQREQIALAGVDITKSMPQSLKGIFNGARAIDREGV